MSVVEPRSPLDGHVRAGRRGAGGVTCRPVRLSIVEIAKRRGAEVALAALIDGLLDVSLPAPCRFESGPHGWLIAVAPRVWWAVGPSPRLHEKLSAMPEEVASAIDIGHGHAVIELGGPSVHGALARLVRLDLHPSAFPPGSVARTPMAQAPVTLALVDAAPRFLVIVPATLARSTLDAILHAAEPFGVDVLPPD